MDYFFPDIISNSTTYYLFWLCLFFLCFTIRGFAVNTFVIRTLIKPPFTAASKQSVITSLNPKPIETGVFFI